MRYILIFTIGLACGMIVALGMLDRLVGSCPYLDETVMRVP